MGVLPCSVGCDTKALARDPADPKDSSESFDEVMGSFLPCDLLCLASLAWRLSGVIFLEDLALAGSSASGRLDELRASRWCLRRSARAISGVVWAMYGNEQRMITFGAMQLGHMKPCVG